MVAAVRALWPYAATIVVVALEWPLLSPSPAVGDHFQFWAAGHLAASGISVYDRAAWEAMTAYGPVADGVAVNTVPLNLAHTGAFWLYPPQTALLFAPFGALPLAVAIPLLHYAVLASAAAGLVIAARALGLRGSRLALALTLAVVSQPFVIVVRNGHPIGLVLAGVALLYIGLRDRRAATFAAGAVLISIKPQIAVVAALGALAYLVVRRDRRLAGWGALAVALVTLPAWVRDPFPIGSLAAAGDQRLALDLSTVGALARDVGEGTLMTAVITTFAVAATVVAVRLAPRGGRSAAAFGSAAALSLAISPYAHDYDQLVVLPAAFAALAVAKDGRAQLVGAAAAVLVVVASWVLFLWWPLLGQGDRIYQGGPLGALSVIALAALATVGVVARRRATR